MDKYAKMAMMPDEEILRYIPSLKAVLARRDMAKQAARAYGADPAGLDAWRRYQECCVETLREIRRAYKGLQK